MDIYLVQRCDFKDVTDDKITGWDSLVSHQYMGSAEFEFGALPSSLKQLAANFASYDFFNTGLKAEDGRKLILFCLPSDRKEIESFLNSKSKDEYQINTKECVWLKQSLNGADHLTADLWWGLENNWVAFLGEENQVRIELALTRLATRWRSEGKIK